MLVSYLKGSCPPAELTENRVYHLEGRVNALIQSLHLSRRLRTDANWLKENQIMQG